jgi:hypothetical protein
MNIYIYQRSLTSSTYYQTPPKKTSTENLMSERYEAARDFIYRVATHEWTDHLGLEEYKPRVLEQRGPNNGFGLPRVEKEFNRNC